VRLHLVALPLLLALSGGLAGCLSSQPDADGWIDPDPLERSNRAVFAFNEGLDKILLQPIGRVWRFITPQFLRQGLDNAFTNLKFPVRAVSVLGQGRARNAGTETLRFLTNSTIGLVGIWDPASRLFGMPYYDEDFGQMFAVWGIGSGPYWMLPFFGPSSPRGTTGRVFDSVFNLLPSYGVPLEIVNSRAIAVPTVDTARATSLDYYIFLREAYLGQRAQLIEDRGPTWLSGHPDQPEPEDDDFYDDDAFYEADPDEESP
jgi:phospholipid-binding lipoprotein MlaA